MSFRERAAALTARVQQWHGDPARYTPAEGGAAIVCTAIPRTTDAEAPLDPFVTRTLQTRQVMDVLRADVGARPQKGAIIELLDAEGEVVSTWQVTEAAMSTDRYSYVWACAVAEAEPVEPPEEETAGQPFGLLLALTIPGAAVDPEPEPEPDTEGQPFGLLLALMEAA